PAERVSQRFALGSTTPAARGWLRSRSAGALARGCAPGNHPDCVRVVTARSLRSRAGPGFARPQPGLRFAPTRLGAGPLRSPAQRPFRLRLQDLKARWRGPG
ncbi:hypothetical protein ACFYNN_36360, partial [Streptomyces sp. NPDC006978]|uniref:hypothetical protein n=1 Tax=Streptomyces sp. NPDC006978 TaxID=3364769 RepID=UPI0036A46DC0